jgi:LysM domain
MADSAAGASMKAGRWSLAFLVLTVAMLHGCATESKGGAPATALPPAPSPAPEAPPPPPPPPPPPKVPATQAQQQQAQRYALAAVDALESGNEDLARTDIASALGVDWQNKLALSLARQMTDDPAATLGRESFAYTVKSGETLSKIAQRYLNDLYAFYILARYNDIKVPKLVSSGQVIRVPGKASALPPAQPPPRPPTDRTRPGGITPPPTAANTTPTPPPPAAVVQPPAPTPPALTPGEQSLNKARVIESAGNWEGARAEYLIAAGYGVSGAAEKAEDLRKKLVARHTTAARTAFAKQDLSGAMLNWQRVLVFEPNHPSAKLEYEKARDLEKRLKE